MTLFRCLSAVSAVALCLFATPSWATDAVSPGVSPGLGGDVAAPMAWDPAHTPLEASATLSADGAFTLVLVPEVSWSQAEISVSGDGTQDLGPFDGSAPLEVMGVREGVGPIFVTLAAVTADDRGVSWSFEVQPELLPVAAPAFDQGQESRRSRRGRRKDK